MKAKSLACAALVAMLMPVAALADDPNDMSMRNPAARARDHEMTRQLNLAEIARVQERDAGYSRQWRSSQGDSYAQSRARYEREMAQWRRAVAACRAGDYSACGN